MQTLVQNLFRILGPQGWVSAPTEAWTRDWLNRFGEPPLGVARPASTDEVSRVIATCHAAGVPVVPQGGNTSLCGGSVLGMAGGIILSLSRMNACGTAHPVSASIEVEAGVVLGSLHTKLLDSGFMFPMHLGAEGSAQIGGLIATNAGGNQSFRFGMMQDLVLGLEVVLADGRIWNGLRSVQKDNAGYQLRKLFCGSEGTLGIVTRAVLRLCPEPKHRATALLALPDFDAALAMGAELRRTAGDVLTGLDFFSDLGLGLALKHIPSLNYPLGRRTATYLIVEAASNSDLISPNDIIEANLAWGLEHELIEDGSIAVSDTQRYAFWRLREEQPEGQRLEGRQLKHDISVPPGEIARFIRESAQVCECLLPAVRINPFGHLADGNIHYNLSPPVGSADFAGKNQEIALTLAALAQSMGGSFAAEHGLGRAKVYMADHLRDPVERDLMGCIKRAFDPDDVLNPGAVVK